MILLSDELRLSVLAPQSLAYLRTIVNYLYIKWRPREEEQLHVVFQ